jgi:predicted DNA-binding transcriptional regulator
MKTTHPRGVEMLKSFGLTQNEALIYTYLLERGVEVGTSKIAQGTGLHRQYVYISMGKLIESGLVESVPYGKQSKYKATPPAHIEKIARRKTVEAEDIVRELNTFSAVGNEQDFEIIQGKEAIQRYEMDYVLRAEPGSEEYIIGGNSKGFELTMEDLLDEYTSIKDTKEMKVYYIGGEGYETERYKNQKSFIFRLLPRLPQRVTHMLIRQDKVLFYSFLNPPLLYALRSKEVVADYKNFFTMLWDIAGTSKK